MKLHIIVKTLLLSGALFIASCSHNESISDQVSSAELAIVNEDVTATRNICNGVLDNADRKAIEATEYARLSILYMQLNDRTDDPHDVEYAVRCYKEAFKLNSDSAKAFYQSLPVDQDKYAMTLATIVHTLDNPREIPSDHDWEMLQDEVGNIENQDSLANNR